jgi:arylsulfatase A-like enzyme
MLFGPFPKLARAVSSRGALKVRDNGGCAESIGRVGPVKNRGAAPSLAPLPEDYLQPDMIPKQTRDGLPMRMGKGVLPGWADTYIGYGRDWANVSNTPFREYKPWQHEGGISTSLIAHWPAGIPTGKSGENPGGRMVPPLPSYRHPADLLGA